MSSPQKEAPLYAQSHLQALEEALEAVAVRIERRVQAEKDRRLHQTLHPELCQDSLPEDVSRNNEALGT